MKRIVLAITLTWLTCTAYSDAAGQDWLGFRGDSRSVADRGPDRVDAAAGGNLVWKLDLPGRSVSGPIVVGDLVVTTGSGGQDGERLDVSGIGLSDGQLRWGQSFRATGRPYSFPTSANAAPTPASDGKRIFAFFGSNDLICLDLEGALVWYRGLTFDYPTAANDIGMASSPVIAGDVVIVQVESQGDSFAAGIDAATGKNLWKVPRPRSSNWASPVVIDRPDGARQVVLQGDQSIVGLDVSTGAERWRIDQGRGTISSPTVADGLLLLPGDDLMALDYRGTASEPQEVWREGKLAPQNASVAATADRTYSLKGSVLVAAELATGRSLWTRRIADFDGGWATPAVAGDLIYLIDQTGHVTVLRDLGEDIEVVSQTELNQAVLASPAISQGHLIIRGLDSIFCFR